MSFLRTRYLSSSPSSSSLLLEKHLHSLLSSSNSYSYSHSLPKTLPRRSSATPLSSCTAGSRISFLSALLFQRPLQHRPILLLLLASAHPSPRAFFSTSSGQELKWHEDHHQLPQEHCSLSPSAASCSDDDDDGGYQDHLLEIQQEKQSRFIPVKAYFLCTRSLTFSAPGPMYAQMGQHQP